MTLSKEGRTIMLSTLAACVAVSLSAWLFIFPPLSWLVIAAAALFLLFIVRFFRLPRIDHAVDDTKVFFPLTALWLWWSVSMRRSISSAT